MPKWTSDRSREASVERQRMRAYTRMYWEKEVPVLEGFGLRDGMSVVELGSGPGVVTDLLLRRFPRITTTSVELREEVAERARDYLRSRGHEGFRVLQADILDTGLPAGTFEFAYARLVFRYLPDPGGAIREILRILKPGGVVVISDIAVDLWGIFDPPLPELQPALDAYDRMVASRHGDANIGRRLVGLLKTAGLLRPRMEAVAATSQDLAEGMSMETFLAPIGLHRLERMVEDGWLTGGAATAARRAWERFLATPSPFVMKVMLMAGGQKPPGG